MRLFYFVLIILILLFFVACDNTPKPIPSPIPTEQPLPDNVTYTEHMLPLFTISCKPCHNSSTPNINWMDYTTAYNKRDRIKQRIENRTMPLGLTITDQQRKLIIKWVDQGAKK